YGIVSVRGFLGVRATRKIVPVTVLSSATTKKRTLALDVDVRRWKKAPQFRRSELATLGEPRRAREISGYYGHATPESRLPQVAPQGGTRPLLSATGRDGGVPERQPRTEGSFHLAGELVAHDVSNRQSQTLG